MSWYNGPDRQLLPFEYAYLNDGRVYETPGTNMAPAAPLQYTPPRFASSSNFPHLWPPAHSHSMPENFENIPPIAVTSLGGERKSKKRKHYEARDYTTNEKRSRLDKVQAYETPYPPQHPIGHESVYNIKRAAPMAYVPATGNYSPLDQQSATPTTISSHVTFGAPSLPGAARYQQRQLDQSAPPPANNTHAAETSWVHKFMTPEHAVPPPSSQDRAHPRLDSAKEHYTSRHLYPSLPKQFAGSSALPRGTQHNPLEIPSSPEREPKTRSLKKKKKHFYAVAAGHVPGIYKNWDDAEVQIKGDSGAKQRGFATEAEAKAWLEKHRRVLKSQLSSNGGFARTPETSMRPQQISTPVQSMTSAQLADRVLFPLSGLSEPMVPNGTHRQAMSDAPDAIPFPPATLVAAQPRTNDAPIDPEPILKPEQQKVVDLILQGHNVFYTGSAGCGKSTILKAFVKQLQLRGKRVKIVAPTNLAALNVGGVTTWNFAGWTPDSLKKSLDKLMHAAHGKEVWERFDTTDVLVIDEISMVENLVFERINHVMKASRGDKYGGGPFGGVQIIVTGDFCQLSPVKPFQYCIGCGWELIRDNKYRPKEYRCENKYCREDVFYDVDKWAFRSKAWDECSFKHINLTEIHRQSDKKFISILQKIRTDGVILKPHANILLNHTSETEDAIKLFARRDDVDRINNDNIARLPSEARTYKCVDHFSWEVHHRDDPSLEKNMRPCDDGTLTALKEHRYEVSVQLKEDMRVVLQANLEPSMGLVNGSQGLITGFEPFDDKRLPRKSENRSEADMPGVPFTRGAHARYFEEQIKIFGKTNKRQPWPIVKFDNGLTRTIFADCTASELGNEEPYSLLSRTQIPLMAGYAITVHKSQGMTLDRVIVDLARAFEPSQIYVALSRARSLKGLKVVGLPRGNLGGANEQVKEFFEKFLRNK